MARKGPNGIRDIFATKTGLQDDDFDITNKLRQVKRYYDHLYQIVDDLSESYDCYMTNCWPAFIRYIKLKSMITECICRYNAKWDTINDHTGLRGAMEKAAEIKNIKSDYGMLHTKAELRTDISKKKEELQRIQTQTVQLKSAIEKLQREFNASRNYGIIRRYGRLKKMTKKTIAEMRQCHCPM